MALCEVRIPTYKRPDLLQRAIATLQAQTCRDWVAIVMDDSPAQEGRSVAECGDGRIIYQPNPVNLGRSKNLDQAFRSKSYRNCRFAFVLEDDNYLFPHFIEANIALIEQHRVRIVQRNQEMRLQTATESLPMGRTTLGHWYEERTYAPLELYAHTFFFTGISNGGLFWDTTTITSDLQVGPEVEHSSFQEIFRCLQVTDPVYFAAEPECAFTYFESRNDIPRTNPHQDRIYNRAQQSIYMFLVKKYGLPLITKAHEVAVAKDHLAVFESRLLDALYTSFNYTTIAGSGYARTLCKSWLRYWLYANQLAGQYQKPYYRVA